MTTPAREYELALLLTPSFSETDATEFVEKFIAEKLGEMNAKVTFQDFWGRKNLAYPINKETSAYYVILRFTAAGDSLIKFDEEIRLDANILRHLLTSVDKHDVAMTLAEIKAWNTENLPKEKKSNKPVEKRAQLKSRRPAAKRPAARPAAEKTAAPKLDKKQLDKKLDEILDADI